MLKARPSWVKLKSWLILSSTTPRGYYFHPFPDDRAEGAKYRFSGFTPNKQTNKQTSIITSRFRHLTEKYAVLEASQFGFRNARAVQLVIQKARCCHDPQFAAVGPSTGPV